MSKPDPGYIKTDPYDGHSVSFPDTSQGTDTPLEFAAHVLGVPEFAVGAINKAIDTALSVVPGWDGWAEGGYVGDDSDITRDAEDPEAAQRAIDAVRSKRASTRSSSTNAARRRVQAARRQAAAEPTPTKVMLPKPPPGRSGYYKITRR